MTKETLTRYCKEYAENEKKMQELEARQKVIKTRILENLIDSMVLCSTALQPRYNKIVMDNSELDFNKMNSHINLIVAFIFNTTPYLDKLNTEQKEDNKDYITKIIWNKCVMEI